LRTGLRLVGIVCATCLLASCSSAPAQNSQPGQQGQPGQTDQAQPPGVAANASGLSLVAVTVSTTPADAGFQNVDVFFGVRNNGTDIVKTEGANVVLAIAEGRTYSAQGGGYYGYGTFLPPGITVCGDMGGPFSAGFKSVPAAATLQTLSFSGTNAVSGLDKPIGSCPTPSLGNAGASAEARSPSQPSLPGFAMKFVSNVGGGQFVGPGGQPAAAGFTVTVTVSNHATLDALSLMAFVITSKGFVVTADWSVPSPSACSSSFSVGPGQSGDISYCFRSVDQNGKDIGTPLGLLLVSDQGSYSNGGVTHYLPAGAYGIVTLPH
jgi:hypothetical protein